MKLVWNWKYHKILMKLLVPPHCYITTYSTYTYSTINTKTAQIIMHVHLWNNHVHWDFSDTRGKKNRVLLLIALEIAQPNWTASRNVFQLGRKQSDRHFFHPNVLSDCTAPTPISVWSFYLLWIGHVNLKLKKRGKIIHFHWLLCLTHEGKWSEV